MARYRIIDRLLADPNRDYTTKQILEQVNWTCPNVTLRMIQKDIKTLEEEFGKELVRNAGRRGTVRYADQSEPLFYQELTGDEEEVLREVLVDSRNHEDLSPPLQTGSHSAPMRVFQISQKHGLNRPNESILFLPLIH